MNPSSSLRITGNPVTCFVRVEGSRAGRVREFLAAVSPTSRYCVMRRGDAASLGLATTNFPRPYPGTGTLEVVGGLEGLSEHEVVTIPRMILGRVQALDVETMLVEYSMPETIGVDVVLGSTFFSEMRVVFDNPKGLLTMVAEGRAPPTRTPDPAAHK